MEPRTPKRASKHPDSGCPQLILSWQGRELRLAGEPEASFSIGLLSECDLITPGAYASREHACLVWQRSRFQLIDHSTNGTFVQLEDEQVNHVHRASIHLWGTGYLSFGEPPSSENTLRFSHE